ncbi:NAD(P)-binding protein [Nadsonia fulvescens var. elongata DSM 6958]|uniref:NAD(P)-binding protein n=1 Tax=Nadsonia fulvescens var. elongata DSM 6958 TaxID=857566 RepID=A0A1E3PJ87_9ASCO|nr:NAD(P)-binding protein [Nadsonia fulvescens var. elongata DSM 6958]
MTIAPTTVLLTGASGFIASHIVKQLLEQGFHVVGTVRSQAKADYFINRYGKEAPLKFAIVEDIVSDDAFDKVLQEHPEITAVLHTASPFHFNATDYEEHLYAPAVKGTRNILESVRKFAPQVKRVIITSSYAAIMDISKEQDSSFTITEKTWNPMTREDATDPRGAYCLSKKLAEAAAWEFVEQNEDQLNFTVSTINPPFVWGPLENQLDVNSLNTSNEFLLNIFLTAKKLKEDGKDNGDVIPGGPISWVDVRDVAWAHIDAITNPKAPNQRWWITPGHAFPQEIVNLLHQGLPKFASGIAIGNPEKPEIDMSCRAAFDNHITNEQTGIKYIPLSSTIKDAFGQFLTAKSA